VKEIYFVRHAQSDASVAESEIRPLTEKGLLDRGSVNAFLKNANIGRIYSSPYRRAVDTVRPLAEERGLTIQKIQDFREWMGGRPFPQEEFADRMRALWADFSFQTGGCESLQAVENRTVRALTGVLRETDERASVIGAHGLMLSVIIHHFYPLFGADRFFEMLPQAPWIVKMFFDDNGCAGMRFIDPLSANPEDPGRITGMRVQETGSLSSYRYVVVFARHKGKWAYARAKSRKGFETAGGHIEKGETPLDAAKRELYEETGAKEFEIRPLFDYAVDREHEYANGQVFFAEIRSFSEMPDFEMEELALLDGIPSVMRFPQILPFLFEKVQSALAEG